jgi:hypothetical protein
MRGARPAAVACALLLAAVVAGGEAAGGRSSPSAARAAPISSLEPHATAVAWRRLVHGRTRSTAQAAGCRPLRAVFYAATDWLRLATRLAASASPCADYSISIPPLVSDKTRSRADQAWRIRALGPSFHALAEISWNAWSAWVAAGSGTWYQAGAEARRRMAEAGYDVALGDGWVLNELSSAVRRGDGVARPNAREFLRGLYEGDGTVPRARGAVFMVGISQATADLSTYKAHLQNWLQDAPFWADMAAYVRDWSQESYGDVRSYAVPGAPLGARRDALRAYLGHGLALVRGGPEPVAAARAFFEAAYNPLANAAWEWGDSFGWTAVPVAEMSDFVSAQTYALRNVDPGATTDRWGFAWHPRNESGIPAGDFTAQTRELLDRLAAAIRDSADLADSGDPGLRACAPAGVNVWCVAERPGSAFNQGWSGFTGWTQPGARFTTPARVIAPGVASEEITVQLQLGGVPQLAPSPAAVEVTSSSPTGAFSFGPDGPWTPTLAAAVPAGATSVSFRYLDAQPGTPTLTARAAGGSAVQAQTIASGSTGGGGSAAADLALSGSVEPAEAPVGSTVTWRLRVDDRTLQPVFGVFLDVELPPGQVVTGSTADRGSGCVPTAATRLRCNLDFLLAAAPTANVVLTTTVAAPGTHVLGASVGFAGADPTPADNVVSLQMLTRAPPPPAPAPVARRGGPGADVLVGGPGADVLLGRRGDDVLRGLGGNDRLVGGPGSDLLVGGPGLDRLVGGAGGDVVRARDGRGDVIACGPGRDRVVADRADRIASGCERVTRDAAASVAARQPAAGTAAPTAASTSATGTTSPYFASMS